MSVLIETFLFLEGSCKSFNGCCKEIYEKVAAAVLYFTPGYESTPKNDLPPEGQEELCFFFEKYKRRFFDGRCQLRPMYSVKLNEEGRVVYDEEGVPILFVNTYVKGQLKTSKRLLYQEAVDGVLCDLHQVKGVDGGQTCLPGGVNALSRSFNERFCFKGSYRLVRAFLAKCSSCQVNNPLPMTFLPPPVAIRSFRPHSRIQIDLIDMAPKKHRGFMSNNRWGYRYVLTVKCCFSKFCWLFPLKSKSADEVCAILKALFVKEGAPTIIQSDNGGEFIGEVVKQLCKEFDVRILHGRPHHPQSQGQIENLNKQVKRLLARFLQRLTKELQANMWPVLLSPIADMLNSKWHSTINDIPFRVYKNREPSCQASHVVPDDNFWLDSVEDCCLEDYVFQHEDFVGLGESNEINLLQVKELTEAICKISADNILSFSLGESSELLVPVIRTIFEENYQPSSCQKTIELADSPPADVEDSDFQAENITKFLANLSENNKVMMLDVLEATEHTIHKNHKRSLRKAKQREFKIGDKVLFRHPSTELSHFSKADPFKPMNEVGIIKEVLPGGIYKVQIECEEEVVVKSIFSGQMVLFHDTKQELPHDECPTTFSLVNVHNSISEFGLTVRKEIYNKGLRLSKSVSCGNVDAFFKSYCEVLDYGLLATLSSLSGKEDEQVFFHQKFVAGIDLLQKSGFRYFLYGTIFWERKRKQNLDSCILAYLTSHQEHSDCLSCVSEQKQEPCNHACCQHFVFQLAINSGLFCQGEDGRIETNVQFLGESKVVDMMESTHSVSQTNREDSSKVQNSPVKVKSTTTQKSKEGSIQNNTQQVDHSNGVNIIPVNVNSSNFPQDTCSPIPDNKSPLINTSQVSTPSTPVISFKYQGKQFSLEELKATCLLEIESIGKKCSEMSEFLTPLKIFVSEIQPLHSDATEIKNLSYLLKVIGKHANKQTLSQVRLCNSTVNKDLVMQIQGHSSFCGLCAMNNTIGVEKDRPPVFDVFDLDLAADLLWLKQVCEVGCGFSVPSEPMRCLDGDYSILAMEEAALKRNFTFKRMDVPLRALVDGTELQTLDDGCVKELYSLVLGLFSANEKPSLIIRTKKYHFVTLLFQPDKVVLFDSQRTCPLLLPLKDGLGFIQREASGNPEFAAVKLQAPGTCDNPVVVDELSGTDIEMPCTNFQCTSDEVWDPKSTIADDTIISTLHGQVTAKDLRSLKPGNQINDVVVNYIGSFLMSQKDSVYVASTFWLNRCSKGRFHDLKKHDLQKFKKFIFPVHCPGHWWCVMIDTSDKLYGEYDSLCQNRSSGYVFELLHNIFQSANIDLSSFRKLNQQERQHIPSQGDNTTECGVFLLGFMCAFVNCLKLSFDLNFTSYLRHSFAKIIMNGRPSSVQLAASPTVCIEETKQTTTGSEIPETVSGSVNLKQDNNQQVNELSCENVEVVQSNTGMVDCAKAKRHEEEIIPCSIQLVGPSNSDSIDAAMSSPVHDGDMSKVQMNLTDDIEDDPFDLPPPLPPLDPWPLDDDAVTAQKDETGKEKIKITGLQITNEQVPVTLSA